MLQYAFMVRRLCLCLWLLLLGHLHNTGLDQSHDVRTYTRILNRVSTWRRSKVYSHTSTIYHTALAFGLDPEIIAKQQEVESYFRFYAVSPAGAVGVAQVIPRYHEARMARLGGGKLIDPDFCTLVQCDLMRELLDEYGDYEHALIVYGYNHGRQKALECKRKGLSPYRYNYVRKVMGE